MKRTDPADQRDQAGLEARSLACQQANTEPSKTLQGPTHECDINNIAKAYGLTGKNMIVPPEVFDPIHYQDLSEVPDLQTMLNLVKTAEQQFMQLPAEMRRQFHDSPAVLWDFVNDPRNADQAVEMGLLKRRENVPPTGSQTAPNANPDPASVSAQGAPA